MSRIFRAIFCGHFPWKLKDENLRKISPKFRRIFRRSLRKISQELRSGELQAQLLCHTNPDFEALEPLLLVFNTLGVSPTVSRGVRGSPRGAWKNSVWAFFVTFSWLFRFGQILRVLALEQSSDNCSGLLGASGGATDHKS